MYPKTGDPQSLNRYSYVRNNPTRYIDPTGHFLDTLFDIVSVVVDIVEFVKDPSLTNFGALALDVAAAAIPILPAGAGLIARGGKLLKYADDVAEVAKPGGKAVAKVVNEATEMAAERAARKAAGSAADTAADVAKPIQTHHMATNKSQKWTAQFESIAGKYKLDMDDAWNKLDMPHQGRHADGYHNWILEQMQAIDNAANGSRDEFLKLFKSQVTDKVAANPDIVTGAYWRHGE